MKKFWIQVIILSLIIFTGFYIYSNPDFILSFMPNYSALNKTQIKVGSNIINVEVADTASERANGLSGRDSIATDSGVLFIFAESKKYQFWMKGMKFPVDMIFINNGSVVDILENVPVPQPGLSDSALPLYQPTTNIDMLLEAKDGYVNENNVKVGDSVFLIK